MSPSTINFPTLQPALICKFDVGDVHPVGKLPPGHPPTLPAPATARLTKRAGAQRQSGSTLIHFAITAGALETADGFEPRFKADVVFGSDRLTIDPDKRHARVNLKAIATTEDGKAVDFGIRGAIRLDESIMNIFNQHPDAESVPFGPSSLAVTFQSGADGLEDLENSIFVGNGRMLVDEKSRTVTVETRVSKVVPATGFD